MKNFLGFMLLVPLFPVLLIFSAGCESVGDLGEGAAQILAAQGVITTNEAQSIARSSHAVAKTFQDITPEQEYYIGRAVAASVLSKYRPFTDDAATRYVNLVGQTLAAFSDKPDTFGGYHFLILDSNEINAFACPGGLVFVTRGLLRVCRNEDELAAVLAHEIGHVENEHGLQAIKKSRLTSALTILAAESAKQFGGQDLAEVTRAFEGSIRDITSTMMNSGYARRFEKQADRSAVKILGRAGYNPGALVSMLESMSLRLQPGRHDFAQTHPPPAVRIRAIRRVLGAVGPVREPPARSARFRRAMRGV